MMTIKHVDHSGKESVVAVESTLFDKQQNCLIGCGPNRIELIRWTSGHAFVMNEQGKTVAVYNITMPLK